MYGGIGIDSHVHPGNATRMKPINEIPQMDSIADVLDYVRGEAKVGPQRGMDHCLRVFINATSRATIFPTRANWIPAAPEHPVSFRTGPRGEHKLAGFKRERH